MGLIGGTIVAVIGAAVGWVLKGKVSAKDKEDPYKNDKENY